MDNRWFNCTCGLDSLIWNDTHLKFWPPPHQLIGTFYLCRTEIDHERKKQIEWRFFLFFFFYSQTLLWEYESIVHYMWKMKGCKNELIVASNKCYYAYSLPLSNHVFKCCVIYVFISRQSASNVVYYL